MFQGARGTSTGSQEFKGDVRGLPVGQGEGQGVKGDVQGFKGDVRDVPGDQKGRVSCRGSQGVNGEV